MVALAYRKMACATKTLALREFSQISLTLCVPAHSFSRHFNAANTILVVSVTYVIVDEDSAFSTSHAGDHIEDAPPAGAFSMAPSVVSGPKACCTDASSE